MEQFMEKSRLRIVLCFVIICIFCSLIQQNLSAKSSLYERLKNKKINITFRDTGIDDMIKIFSEKMNVNIIRNKNVKAKITANLKNIGVFDALDIICKTHNINYLIEESVSGEELIRIYTQKDYLQGLLYRGTSEVIKLRHAKAEDVYKKLQDSGGLDTKADGGFGGGIIYADEKSNSIIVVDKNLTIKRNRLRKIIESFDQPTPQVLIEAKILQVSLNDETRFGINWEVLWRADILMPFGGDKSSDFSASKTWKFNDNSGTITGLLTALSEQGDVKVLSNPRIVVLNNEPAKIIVGKNEPYTVTTTIPSGGNTVVTTDTKFVEVGIGLTVTPQINSGQVQLKIKPKVSSAAERKSDSVAPTVTKSEAETVVTVKDKSTLILGGLIETKQTETIKRVPILGHIPLLGYLFSSRSWATTRSELVIFLSPTIITGEYTTKDDVKNLKDVEEELKDD